MGGSPGPQPLPSVPLSATAVRKQSNMIYVIGKINTRRVRSERSASVEDNLNLVLVDWDGPNDPQNPGNWSNRRKWAATLMVSAFNFLSPLSSSMIAPASVQVALAFDITNRTVLALTVSIFVLGFAMGPILLGPLSEIYGRSRVLQLSFLFYLAWNIGCGFCQNESQLIVFRFLAGVGGSAPLSIGGAVLGDVWSPQERGTAIAIYALAPLLGPVIGPVCGGWIAEKSTWRWVFWSTSIVAGSIQFVGFFLLQETYAPLILERKAISMRKKFDLESREKIIQVRTIFDNDNNKSVKAVVTKALIRPFSIFLYEPIIQVLGAYMAFIYGIIYLFFTTIPSIYANVYHESPGFAGLHYIALGIGLCTTSLINAAYMDRVYSYFTTKNNGVAEPEYRLPFIVPGSILLPLGLFLEGWAAQNKFSWIVADIGNALASGGMIMTFMAIQAYIVDCFTLHAASALAAVSCFRSLAGFGFPLFAPAMYQSLGYGKGNSLLAAVSIALGCPAPFILWKYGKRIRMSSRFARKSST